MWERLWERCLELGGNSYEVLVPRASTELDKIFDQALILWCGMVTCGRAEIPVLGRDMGALGFKFPTTHRAYGGAGSERRRAEGGRVRSFRGNTTPVFLVIGIGLLSRSVRRSRYENQDRRRHHSLPLFRPSPEHLVPR